jgi:hypothetical protein
LKGGEGGLAFKSLSCTVLDLRGVALPSLTPDDSTKVRGRAKPQENDDVAEAGLDAGRVTSFCFFLVVFLLIELTPHTTFALCPTQGRARPFRAGTYKRHRMASFLALQSLVTGRHLHLTVPGYSMYTSYSKSVFGRHKREVPLGQMFPLVYLPPFLQGRDSNAKPPHMQATMTHGEP